MTYPDRTERLVSIGTVHPAGLIRELASNPAQQQASMFQRGMQENPDAPAALGERVRSRPPQPDDTPELAELRAAAYGRLDVESVANFYKANWPRPPFSLETEGFGFRSGEFPPVQAPTLLIYGKDSQPFTSGTLNDTWRWVDAPLTLLVLPGIGHGPHTQAPRDRHAGDSRVAPPPNSRKDAEASPPGVEAGQARPANPAATAAVQRLSNRTHWRSSRSSLWLTAAP